jgi:HD superfamily phosphohydrolase
VSQKVASTLSNGGITGAQVTSINQVNGSSAGKFPIRRYFVHSDFVNQKKINKEKCSINLFSCLSISIYLYFYVYFFHQNKYHKTF